MLLRALDPTVNRRGPYWSAREFYSIIMFEAALVRFLRIFSRNHGLERHEISDRIDRIRSGFSQEMLEHWKAESDPIVFLVGFLDLWKKINRRIVTVVTIDDDYLPIETAHSAQMTLASDANEALGAAKKRLRNPRKFMTDETYWPSEQWRRR